MILPYLPFSYQFSIPFFSRSRNTSPALHIFPNFSPECTIFFTIQYISSIGNIDKLSMKSGCYIDRYNARFYNSHISCLICSISQCWCDWSNERRTTEHSECWTPCSDSRPTFRPRRLFSFLNAKICELWSAETVAISTFVWLKFDWRFTGAIELVAYIVHRIFVAFGILN